MTRGLNIPFFPNPPADYSQRYMSQLVQSFAFFAQQLQTPGPWRATQLELTTSAGNIDRGQLSWNIAEETLDLTHGDGVVQQVGFETFMRCENATGVTLPNGTVVGFSGAGTEVEIAPYLADGSQPEVYFVGVTTTDLLTGEIRPVTLYGKVRGLDTSGAAVSETWAVGDILYASPATPGALTKVRPTAPDVVIVVALVLVADSTDGVLLVRPTIPLGLRYGTFSSGVDQTLAAANTATAITLDGTYIANGVAIGTPASRITLAASGLYRVAASFQLTSASASAKDVFFWVRHNGVDMPGTTRAVTVVNNGAYFPAAVDYDLSLASGDYVELFWASSDTNIRLDALAASAFAPSAPSVLVSVTQLQL